MAEIRGTAGPDTVTVKTGDLFLGEGGNDIITLERWSSAAGGPGQDSLIAAPGTEKEDYPFLPMLFLYYDQGVVTVDLGEGYLLDPYGSRDTLVNIQRVDGLKFAGDRAYGSDLNNFFFLNPGWREFKGTILVDGRGGRDMVGIGDGAPEEKRGAIKFEVSPDARLVRAWHEGSPNLVYELRNIELLGYTDKTSGQFVSVTVQELASLAGAGSAILLRGGVGWQTAAPGTPVSMSYSFLQTRPAEGAEGGSGFWALDAAQKNQVRSALTRLSEQTGLRFVETDGSVSEGQIRFGINQQTDTRGYAFVPDAHRNQAKAGDVWLDVETAAQLNPGQEGYYALLHELGHALGLQHPLGEQDQTDQTVLLDRFASLANTVMLDRSVPDASGQWPTWFGALDLQALRQLYGARTYEAGDNRYTARSLTANGATTIIDDGGTDVIDAADSPVSVLVDLRPGSFSSMGFDARGLALRGNVLIGPDAWLESAVGTPWDDHLIGNQLDNTLTGAGGNDLLDGLAGLDQAVFAGSRSGWRISYSEPLRAWRVESTVGTGGASELHHIERLKFSDRGIALDLAANQSAGQAALLVGAVIGRQAMLAKPELMGSVISLFDKGVTLQILAGAVMRLPIWAGVLTPSNDPADIARHLLTVVHGAPPDGTTLAAAVASLQTRPQGTLLAELALDPANLTQVGLTGLAGSGLEFIGPGGG